jgi:zinc/manganese transport system permease protein
MQILSIPFLQTALVLCLVLTGIHAYLGYHVIRRGVIFVDLALAQMASLGASVGMLLGWHDGPAWKMWLISFSFALGGAFLFALFRQRKERFPVEALIGITYAGAVALSMILLERSATGTEEIKEMLVGSLFTVSWAQVGQTALLYAGVGLVHWFARTRMILISEDPKEARRRGMRVRLWDFVFYATFALVVTSSVKLAGVLMVFALLILPSTAALVWRARTGERIVFGWLFGGLGCVIGLETSARLDWPAGPSIILVLLVLLVLVANLSRLWLPRKTVDGPESNVAAAD